MESKFAPLLKKVEQRFCSSYRGLIYWKKEDFNWCLNNTNKIERESKFLQKCFVKLIKTRDVHHVPKRKLIRKCQKWLYSFDKYGLTIRSNKKFKKFIKYIKKVGQYYGYGTSDCHDDYGEDSQPEDSESNPDHVCDPGYEYYGYEDSDQDFENDTDTNSNNETVGYGDENEDDDYENDTSHNNSEEDDDNDKDGSEPDHEYDPGNEDDDCEDDDTDDWEDDDPQHEDSDEGDDTDDGEILIEDAPVESSVEEALAALDFINDQLERLVEQRLGEKHKEKCASSEDNHCKLTSSGGGLPSEQPPLGWVNSTNNLPGAVNSEETPRRKEETTNPKVVEEVEQKNITTNPKVVEEVEQKNITTDLKVVGELEKNTTEKRVVGAVENRDETPFEVVVVKCVAGPEQRSWDPGGYLLIWMEKNTEIKLKKNVL